MQYGGRFPASAYGVALPAFPMTSDLLRAAGVAVEGAFGNPEGGADVGDGVVRVGFHRSGQGDLGGGERWFAPSPAAPGARGFEARPGALADEVALELGQGGEDVEDQLAARRRGVDMLLQAFEADAARVEGVDGIDQVREGAAEPVELPDDESVARAEVVQGGFQAGAVGFRAAGDVGIETLRVAAGGEQGVALQVEALVGG